MLKAILAVDQNGGIGLSGTLPWPHNKEDMKWFAEHTTGHIIVMGRKTWDDPKMPKPLPNRINLVTTSRTICMPGVMTIKGEVFPRLKLIQNEYPHKDIFIIGGKTLFESCIPYVEQVYLTQFKGAFRSDTHVDLRWLLDGFKTKTVIPGETCTFSILENANLSKPT